MFGKRGGGAVVWETQGAGAPQPALSPLLLPHPHPRDELKRHYNLGEYWIEVEMEDLASFDEDLADYLYKQPAEHLQLVSGTSPPPAEPPGLAPLWSLTACPPPPLQLEEAAKEVADEVTRPRPAGDEVLQDIQVMLKSDASPSSIRSLKVGPLRPVEGWRWRLHVRRGFGERPGCQLCDPEQLTRPF